MKNKIFQYLQKEQKENPDIIEIKTYYRGDDTYFDGIAVMRPAYMVKFKPCEDCTSQVKLWEKIRKWAINKTALIESDYVRQYMLIQSPEDSEECGRLLYYIGKSCDEFEKFDHEKRMITGQRITEAEGRAIVKKWRKAYINDVEENTR